MVLMLYRWQDRGRWVLHIIYRVRIIHSHSNDVTEERELQYKTLQGCGDDDEQMMMILWAEGDKLHTQVTIQGHIVADDNGDDFIG